MTTSRRLKNLIYLLPRVILAAFFMILLFFMLLGNFDVFEPFLYPLHLAKGKIVSYGNIIVGHYPSVKELKELKRKRGIQVDVSLLDPSLPQEKALDDQLEKRARALGLEYRNFPLGYFDLQSARNRENVAALAAFVTRNRGKKIYIHCYLGRHRVEVARQELIRQGLLTDKGAQGL